MPPCNFRRERRRTETTPDTYIDSILASETYESADNLLWQATRDPTISYRDLARIEEATKEHRIALRIAERDQK